MGGKRRIRGDGTVGKLKSGSWRAMIDAGKDPDTGKRLRLKKTFRTKKEAADWLAEQRAALARGEVAAPTKVTLGEYAGRWLAAKKIGCKESSAGFYEQMVRIITHGANPRKKADPPAPARPPLGDTKLSALTKQTIADWLGGLGVPADRGRKVLTTLRSILTAAVEDKLIPDNPARKVPKPKAERAEMLYWTADQAGRVTTAAKGRRLGAFFVLSLDIGARVGELLGLHWPEVDLEAGRIRIVRTLDERKGTFRLTPPKTPKARRSVKLSPVAVEALKVHREEMRAEGRNVTDGPVFVAKKTGGFIPRWTLARRYFLGLVKAAGVPVIRPHDMRHTNATLLLASKINIKVVSERLGHEDIVTTLRLYAHVMSEQQDEAAEVMGAILSGGKA